jgi:hypothetical protein
MAASSNLMITEAERRFPCRIKLGIPTGGFGARLTEMQAWLDQNCGGRLGDDAGRAARRRQ